VLAAALLVPGCEDDKSKNKKPPVHALSASDSLRGRAPALGQALRFRKAYFVTRPREVDALITPSAFPARLRNPYLSVPRGKRAFRLALRWEDHGRDPFPFEWARFSLRGGGRAPGAAFSHTPIRRLSPTDKRSPRTTILTFLVPDGFRPRELRVASIVAAWRFRARWRLR